MDQPRHCGEWPPQRIPGLCRWGSRDPHSHTKRQSGTHRSEDQWRKSEKTKRIETTWIDGDGGKKQQSSAVDYIPGHSAPVLFMTDQVP